MVDNINFPPFVTVIEHNDELYYGLIKIKSKQFITLYCFNGLPEKTVNNLLDLGYNWWWHSNRIIPISLFMREDMEPFEYTTKRFITNTVSFVQGPIISLSEIPYKKNNRRNIKLKYKEPVL